MPINSCPTAARPSSRDPHLVTKRLPLTALTALSPLDGRYAQKTACLRPYFSEFGLIRARVEVEVEWLLHLSEQPGITELPASLLAATSDDGASNNRKFLRELVRRFSPQDAAAVKAFEATTNHDVKAVEYFLKEKCRARAALAPICEFIHFACTSEDINNLAYGMMLKRARDEVLVPQMRALIDRIGHLATTYADQPMLARTHGQPASPTTVGKELANVTHRLQGSLDAIVQQRIYGKINGAVGNFNAHLAAYPQLDWQDIAEGMVTRLGLVYQPMTTQIEPHDYIAEFCHSICRFNTILLDCNRDLWGYISLGYFRQKAAPGQVGSSTMPHKINPIDFENSEGNLGLANALLQHFAAKLPISRWQRDLSDSTVLRNLGSGMGYTLLAITSSEKGFSRLALNPPRLEQDLEQRWEVLAEPIQTVMRRYGIKDSYEKLKALTQGTEEITAATLHAFIETLDLPDDAKKRLLALTPARYTGRAAEATNEMLSISQASIPAPASFD